MGRTLGTCNMGSYRVPLTHPPIPFKLILCDAAQADVSNGKLHMLGAGWNITSSPTPPHAVALMIQVPWDRANQKLAIKLELLTADGDAVIAHGPTGPRALITESELEVGRPAGVSPGSTMGAAFALNVTPLPLPPGRYEWRATVDGETQGESFQVIENR